jgi:hypothetical protein
MNQLFKFNLTWLIAMVIGFFSTTAYAHFLWVVVEDGKGRVYFSETPAPGDAKLLSGIEGISVWQLEDHSSVAIRTALVNHEDLGWREFSIRQDRPVYFQHDYGILQRGDAKFLLQYYGSYYCSKSIDSAAAVASVEFELVPTWKDSKFSITAYRSGQPVPNCEIQVADETGAIAEGTTNDSGRFEVSADVRNRIWARAKWTLKESGTHEGNSFGEIRQYATLVCDLHTSTEGTSIQIKDSSIGAMHESLPNLPYGVTSFGATTVNGKLFIYGGHLGEAHEYSNDLQGDTLYALDLARPEVWSPMASDRGLQGLALVAHGNALYRLGGFEARNEEDAPHDLHSVAECRKFDLESGKWAEFPDLPEPRSSFDAVVVEDKIFVIGGWTLNGSAATKWLSTAWCFDLKAPNSGWQAIPDPPFKRRAVAVAEHKGKIYVVGGMEDNSVISNKVSIFDLEENRWTEGPTLPPGGRMEGFGSAAFNVDGELLVSTYSGAVYRLNSKANSWELLTEINPSRFFHRLLPLGNRRFVILGGANMEHGKPFDLVMGTIE